MDWLAALISGAFTVVVAGVTYRMTLGAAQRRISADLDLALTRAAVDEKLQKLRSDFDRERISAEQQQLNRRPFLQKQLDLCFEATDAVARLATENIQTEWEKSRRANYGVTSPSSIRFFFDSRCETMKCDWRI